MRDSLQRNREDKAAVPRGNAPQGRLRIGSANDPAEYAADLAGGHMFGRNARHSAAGPSSAPDSVSHALKRPGRPLDASTRSVFEPRFGHDFANVRIHHDEFASESARAVNALAYTVGSDVVFDHGRYAPHTSEGRALLAHELAHVVQQDYRTLRRAPVPTPLPSSVPAAGAGDFLITQVGTSTTSEIFFARNSAALDIGAKTQIAPVKTAKPAGIRLLGFSSADETATVAQQRADSVKTELTASPNPVTVSSAVGSATAQADRSDFSAARKVEIVVGSAAPKTVDCKAKDPVTHNLLHPPKQACTAMDPATWTAFNTAQPIALDAMQRAATSVAGTPDADTAKVIDQFFGNHDAGTVSTLKTNLTNLSQHVKDLPASTQCGGQCDVGNCDDGSTIAYNSGVDAASAMTLCVPTFKDLGSTNDQARNLIHESAHGTTPLGGAPAKGTEDVAYRHERMLFQISTADKLRNSDSYALYAMFLREKQIKKDQTAVPSGISTPASDALNGFSATEKPAFKLALAKLEKRLSWAANWMSQGYGELLSVQHGTSWSATWAEDLIKEVSKRFPVTAPPGTPTSTDQTRVAGIAERFRRMHESVQQDLTATRVAAGVAKWSTPGSGPAFIAGDSLDVGPDFFLATPDDQVSLLLQALAGATKDVEPAFVPAYVSLAAWIHSKNP